MVAIPQNKACDMDNINAKHLKLASKKLYPLLAVFFLNTALISVKKEILVKYNTANSTLCFLMHVKRVIAYIMKNHFMNCTKKRLLDFL